MLFLAYNISQVDVDLKAIREHIISGQYRPDLNDQSLYEEDTISDVWSEKPLRGRLHVFVSLPGGKGSPTPVDHRGECFLRLFAPAQDI
jgi:hypothetical protein